MDLRFFATAALLGLGLAMDAFSVSLANGLHEPDMSGRKMCGIALVFSLFQALMPMIGWVLVHTLVQCFRAVERCIPWIALILLVYIGGHMIVEARKGEEEQAPAIGLRALLMQGIATSIDALSVGCTIAGYSLLQATVNAAVIAGVTFVICMAGLHLGRKVGTRLAGKAGIFGGIILIFIGVEIFFTSFL